MVAIKTDHNKELGSKHEKCRLKAEFEKLRLKTGMGFEVKLKWLPGNVKYKNGKRLLEEVVGNTIFIYVEELAEATHLLAHGFSEWLLNKHTKKYRILINKLIELFEQIAYEEKERVVEAITNLIDQARLDSSFGCDSCTQERGAK